MPALHLLILVLGVLAVVGGVAWLHYMSKDVNAHGGPEPVQIIETSETPFISTDERQEQVDMAPDGGGLEAPVQTEFGLGVQEPQVRGSLPAETIKGLTEMVADFPPLPFNTTSILAEMRGRDVNVRRIVALVSQDPVLSAAVLRMANSAFFAQQSEVTSIERGVLLLGHDTVLSVALRGALAGLVSGTTPGGYDGHALLRHNVVTGLWSGALGRMMPRMEPGEAVTAGLLHDLGKIVLNTGRPEDARQILDPATTRLGESRLAKEERLVGATHAVVGALLCSHWKLPDTLVDAIELHHHPGVTELESLSPRVRELTGVVFVANQMAKLSGCHGDDQEIDLPSATFLPALGLPNDLDQVHAELLPQVERPMSVFLGGTEAGEE